MYLLTRQRFEELVDLINKTRRKADEAAAGGYESGAAQDGHHDEGYQLSLRETSVQDLRLSNLEAIRSNATIVNPAEQNETVQIGTGVVIYYSNGDTLRAVVEGVVFLPTDNERISIDSPLGKAILGAVVGQTCCFAVGSRRFQVQIDKIYPPSQADSVYTD